MGCGCGGSPQVWQPAGQAQNAPNQQQDPNAAIQHQAHAAQRGVWPKPWTGQREPQQA